MSRHHEPRFLNVRETAARLGVHENTVRNWVKEGKLPTARLPGTRNHRFDERDVERLRSNRGADVASVEAERRSIGPELVNGLDLADWARRREAQAMFPELIRRLLFSTPGVTNISVRAGEGIALEGWDGRADSSGAPALPNGSLWFEFGVGGNPKAKADEDYEKRRDDPKGAVPQESIFVFITPRRWGGGNAWAAKRRAEGVFADVRALDADDLEGWLQATPAVHQWISEVLGRRPQDAETTDMWWRRFSTQTVPPLPLPLFLAGRATQRDKLIEFLRSPPEVIAVQARWRNDSLAFVCATIEELGADQVQPPLIVHSPEVWARVVQQPGRMTLIPTFAVETDFAAARERGHHVVLPVGREHALRQKSLELPLPHRQEAADALAQAFKAAGIDDERTYQLSALARRSMPSLIRALARDPKLTRPAWTSPPASELLAPVSLIGAWCPSDEDRAIVCRIAGRGWDEIERTLRQWQSTDDPPFVLSDKLWHVASPEEAFLVLRETLTDSDLRRWHEIAVEVILEPDPRLELPAEEQPMAGLHGIGRKYSGVLRRGIAEGLAVVGSSEGALPEGTTGADRAAGVVRDILERASADESGQTWRSLDDVLPLLAEAAPHVFLDAVHDDLDREQPLLRTMFQDSEDSSWLYTSSPHTGLLWALETLCWWPETFPAATLALARIGEIDPGGRLSNRPVASLKDVFVGWIRHTSAPLSLRIEALEALCIQTPSVAWFLLLGVWPETHGVSSPPHAPRFRDWSPESRSVAIAEWIEYIEQLVRLAIQLAGNDIERWATLAEHVGPLPPSARSELIAALDDFADVDMLGEDERVVLWERIHKEVARHRRFADAEWSMSEDPLAQLDEIASRLEPTANTDRFAYLFDWHPDLPDVELDDYAGHEERLLALRVEALKETLDADGLHGIQRLAARAPVPNHLGWTLGTIAEERLTPQLIQWLDSDESHLREVAAAWASRKLLDNGATWLKTTLTDSNATGERRTALVRQAPATKEIWTALDDVDPQLATKYWDEMNPWRVASEDAECATRRLLEHGRAWAAVDLLASERHRHKGDGGALTRGLVEEVLDAAITTDPAGARLQSLGYELGHLLDYLEANGTDTEKLGQYEFIFFRLLEHHRQPRALFQAMSREASLFVDLVKRVYRPKNEPESKPTEQERALAKHAWWVLHHWHQLPGTREDGTVDGQHLMAWVQEARLALVESDRADIGDEQIGRVLSASPSDSDGVWPAEPVRDLIETIGSASIETGIHVGVMNARGVTSRGIYDGGAQEWELAAKYRKWSDDAARWRRTSRVLRRLAESYERDARRRDAEAQITADTE